MKSVFIMASERSGTNLVRRILGAHPDLVAPPPPHVWKNLARILPTYGPLDNDTAFEALASDACALASIPGAFTTWDSVPDAKVVMDDAEGRSVSHVATALYDGYAAQKGAEGWVCKENELFHHAFDIARVRPDSRFVYLVRDGRDVLASFRRVPHYVETTIDTARRWRDEQEASLRVHQALAPEGASVLVRYEDLLVDTEGVTRNLFDQLDLPYDSQVLASHEAEGARSESQRTDLWKNLSRPVMRNNSGRFRKEVPGRAVRRFERIAGPVLEQLGYPREYPHANAPLSVIERAGVRFGNRIRRAIQRNGAVEPQRRARAAGVARIRARARTRKPRFAPRIEPGDRH